MAPQFENPREKVIALAALPRAHNISHQFQYSRGVAAEPGFRIGQDQTSLRT